MAMVTINSNPPANEAATMTADWVQIQFADKLSTTHSESYYI